MANLTLKDVSKAAGVSVALVSAILNNSNGRIRASKEKAQHVRDVAARLGYVPNSNAYLLMRLIHLLFLPFSKVVKNSF